LKWFKVSIRPASIRCSLPGKVTNNLLNGRLFQEQVGHCRFHGQPVYEEYVVPGPLFQESMYDAEPPQYFWQVPGYSHYIKGIGRIVLIALVT